MIFIILCTFGATLSSSSNTSDPTGVFTTPRIALEVPLIPLLYPREKKSTPAADATPRNKNVWLTTDNDDNHNC